MQYKNTYLFVYNTVYIISSLFIQKLHTKPAVSETTQMKLDENNKNL